MAKHCAVFVEEKNLYQICTIAIIVVNGYAENMQKEVHLVERFAKDVLNNYNQTTILTSFANEYSYSKEVTKLYLISL